MNLFISLIFIMEKTIKIILLFFIFSLLSYPKEKSNPVDSTVTITISAVGDLMCHQPQYDYAKTKQDSFDFNPVFRLVKQCLEKSDFTFGNLETVTAGKEKRYSGYPLFNSPDEFIKSLKYAGFNLLSNANNHALDRGEYGLRRTIDVIKRNGILYNGTYLSQNDRDSIRVFNIKGIKLAFLSYTYGTNGNIVPKTKDYLINRINFDLMKYDLERSKLISDLTIIFLHYGSEYKREPDNYEKKVVDSLINFGADIIIGSHPHVIQPFKYFTSGTSKIKKGLAAYSLGNFISNQQWRYSDAGVIFNISLTKNILTNDVEISGVDFIPTWVYKSRAKLRNEYVIIPALYLMIDEIFKYFSDADYSKMFRSFSDTKEILLKYTTE